MIAKCFETELIHKVGNLEVADYGSKAVTFVAEGAGNKAKVMGLGFQVPEVQKPLAAVWRIAEKGILFNYLAAIFF